jgi:flagellar basal body rod protein FlgG
MLDAISASQLAMNVDQLKLQTISHNIANINTPAFKRELVEHFEFNELVQPSSTEALQQIFKQEIPTQGTLVQTDSTKDFALSSAGYFQVQDDQGVYYTRRGDFHVNEKGELVTAAGKNILGTSGVIQIDTDSFSVDTQGTVFVDHRKIDQLLIAHFEQPETLHYVGNGLYQSEENPTLMNSNYKVLQGFIEQSNSKSIDEMLLMVSTSRHFEASQKVLRTADSMLTTAIKQLGEGNV